jgi:hypothetical protein
MEPQKSAAHRVRHILQAMERSIDTARSRRVGSPATPGASLPQTSTADRTTNHAAAAPAHAATIPAAKNPAPTAVAPAQQTMIGGPPSTPAKPASSSSVSPNAASQAARDGQPPRLKAKPKRFEGTFNSAFSTPPAYRSQAG